jgi:hypothetical protein
MTASWPRCSAFRAGTALVGVLIFSGCRDLSTPTGPRSEDQYPDVTPDLRQVSVGKPSVRSAPPRG